MKSRDFLRRLDDARIVEAIDAAERGTTGEIRVFISHRALGSDDVLARAAARFEKLGMRSTRRRNAVLLYFMPRAQRFAVIGDDGIHAKCGTEFWNDVIAKLVDPMRRGEYTEGIVACVRRIGEVLAQHFPPEPGDRDELPDDVLHD